jgi:hypothetical protein
VKGFKGYIGFVALALCSANVCADLPHSSILSRYGITTEQLPTSPQTETVEPVEEKSRFQIQPEQPFVTFRLGDGVLSQTTGNPIIDRMEQQDLERCRRLQDEIARRGGTYVSCDNSIPGMTLPK